ncbi:MoaD/ThiS family protein [Thermococcus sp.]
MLRVKVIGRGIEREIEWQKSMTIKDVLHILGFNTESAIAKVNGKVVIEDEKIKDGDFIEIIPVVSGG